MSSDPKLSFLDRNQREMHCPLSVRGGDRTHDDQIHAKLRRRLSSRVNEFFQSTVDRNLFSSKKSEKITGDLVILEERDGRIALFFSQKGKKTTQHLDRRSPLFREAHKILIEMRRIWGTHDHDKHDHHPHHSHHKGKHTPPKHPHKSHHHSSHPPVRSEHEIEESDTDSRSRSPSRASAGSHTEQASSVEESDHDDHTSDLAGIGGKPMRTAAHKAHKATEPKIRLEARIERASANALEASAEAERLVIAYNKGSPVAEQAAALIDRMNGYSVELNNLIENEELTRAQARKLTDLREILDQNRKRLDSIISDRTRVGTIFAPILEDLLKLAQKIKDCGEGEDIQPLLEEFNHLVTNEDEGYPKEAGAMLKDLKDRVYFYACQFHPEIRDQHDHRLGQALFTTVDAARRLTNPLRACAIRYAVMEQFALFSPALCADNIEYFRPLFALLPKKEQKQILIQFAEVTDKHIRRKKGIFPKILRQSRAEFLGTSKAGFKPSLNSERDEAIMHWITASLRKHNGGHIRRLIESEATLKARQAELDQRINDLEHQLEEAQGETAKARKERNELQRAIDSLRSEKEEAERELEELRQTVRSQGQQLLAIKTELDDARSQAKRDLAEKNREIEAQRKKIGKLTRSRKQARKQRDGARKRATEAGKHNEQLQRQLQAKTAAYVELEASHTQAKLELATLKDESHRKAEEYRTRLQELEALERQDEAYIAELQQQLDDAEKRALAFEEAAEAAQRKIHKLTETLAKKDYEIARLERLDGAKKALINRLHAEIEGLHDEILNQNHQLEEAREQLAQLQAEAIATIEPLIAEVQKQREALDKAQHDLDAQASADKQTIDALRAKVEDLERALAEATEQLDAQKQQASYAELHHKDEIAELADRIAKQKSARASLTKQHKQKLAKAKKELGKKEERIRQLQEERQSLRDKLSTAGSELAQAQRDLAEQRQQAEQAGRQVEALTEQLKQKTTELAKQKGDSDRTIRELRASLEKLTEQANRNRSELEELRSKSDSLQLKLKEQEHNAALQLAAKQEEISSLQTEQRSAALSTKSLTDSLKDYGEKLAKLRSEKEQATEQAEQLQAKLKQVEQEASTKAEQNAALIAGLLDSVQQKEQANEELQKRISQLEAALESQRSAELSAKSEKDSLSSRILELETAASTTTLEKEGLLSQVTTLRQEALTSSKRNSEELEKLTTSLRQKELLLSQQNDELEQLRLALASATAAVADSERQRAALDSELSTLRESQRSAAQTAKEENELLQAQVSKLAQESLQKDQLIAKLGSSLESAQAKAQDTSRLKELEATIEANKSALETAEKQNKSLAEQIQRLTTEKSEAATKAHQEKTQLLDELQDTSSQLRKATEASKATLQELEELRQQLKQKDARIELLERQLHAQEVEYSKASDQLKQEKIAFEKEKAQLSEAHVLEKAKALAQKDEDLRKLREEIAHLKDDVSSYEHMSGDAHAQVLELNKQLKELRAENEQLKRQLESMRSAQVVAQASFKQTEESMNGHLIRLVQENLQLKGKQVVRLSTRIDEAELDDGLQRYAALGIEPEALEATVPALYRIPPEIRQGKLDPLARIPLPKVLELVNTALAQLLADRPFPSDLNPAERDENILHLAIYLGNHRREHLTKDRALFEKLIKWASSPGVARFNEGKKAKLDTLKIALAESHGHYNGPVDFAIEEGREFTAISDSTKTKEGRFAFAKELLEKPDRELSPLRLHLKRTIQGSLDSAEVPDLEDYTQSISVPGAPPRQIHLTEQLLADPKEYFLDKRHVSGASKRESVVEAWTKAKADREARIDTLIQDSLKHSSFERRIHEIGPTCQDKAIPPSSPEALAKEQADRETDLRRLSQISDAIGNGRSLPQERRLALRESVRDAILLKLKNASGLEGAKETCVDYLAQTIVSEGRLPSLFYKLLCKKNPQELLTVAQLLYYYVALSTEPKDGFGDIANHQSWNWLIKGYPPETGASRLFMLMQECHRPPQFRLTQAQRWAYPMTKLQAKWAEELYKHVRGRHAEPIYADAGTGKTATAAAMIRFFKRLSECENCPVIFLSPYHVEVQGMSSYQFEAGRKEIRVPVRTAEELNGVVIVDEGHLLDPETTISLVHEETERERPFLQMTATPVIPKSGYLHFKTTELIMEPEKDLQQVQLKLQEVTKALQDAREKANREYMEKLGRSILDTIDACKEFMPKGKEVYYLRAVEALKSILRKKDPNPLELRKAIRDVESQLSSWLSQKTRSVQEIHTRYDSITTKVVGSKDVLFEPKGRTRFTAMLRTLEALSNASTSLPSDEVLFEELPTSIHIQTIKKLEGQENRCKSLQAGLLAKRDKWTLQLKLKLGDLDAARYEDVLRGKQTYFADARYTDVGGISPSASSGAFISREIHNTPVAVTHMQLIFPGVRFREDMFDTFVRNLNQEFRRTPAGKPTREYPIYFIYQDSHSPGADKGKQWVISYSESGERTKILLEEWKKTPKKGTVVMLYDKTNMQGGDFGSLSFAGEQPATRENHEIAQFIFCHITDDETNPSETLSENDLFQAIRRRRGRSAHAPHIFGTFAEKDRLLESLKKKQKALEAGWALRTASERIARKLRKATLTIQPRYNLRKGSPERRVLESLSSDWSENGPTYARSVLKFMREKRISTLAQAVKDRGRPDDFAFMANSVIHLPEVERTKLLEPIEHDEDPTKPSAEQLISARRAVFQAEHFAKWYLTAIAE